MPNDREFTGVGNRSRAWSVWLFVALACGSIVAVRGRDAAWPLVGWLMYWRTGNTPTVVRTIRVDVTTVDGQRISVFPTEPLTHSARPLVESVMWQAFGPDDSRGPSRRFLLSLLESRLGEGRIRSAAGFRLEWDTPPLPKLRRIARDEPDREIPLGSFRVASLP